MFDLQSLVKYILEGFAVAIAAFLIPRKTVDPQEIALIALTAAAIFAVLDQFSPLTGMASRQGSGFGIGYGLVNQVGFGYPNEGFEDQENFEDQPETFDDTSYEGYDDYEHMESEGFADNSSGPPSGDKKSDNSGICKMDGSNCGYDKDVKDENRSKYVCHKDNDKCEPIRACKKNDKGDCTWTDNAKDASGIDGRSCHMKDKNCVLSKDEGFDNYEGFEGSDEIQGFEGFSKVF